MMRKWPTRTERDFLLIDANILLFILRVFCMHEEITARIRLACILII